MLIIGCHLSSAKGYEAMVKEAEKIEANTFQFFTRNPRGGNAKEIKEEDVRAYGERARKQGITLISELLNEILTPSQTTTVLLETMAGKGSEVGRNFEELREILDRVTLSEKMGVCLDTCHVYDGGYDIVGDLDGVLTEFDQVIGLDKLKAIHLNDSMYGFESHKDRHARIGEGKIGLEAITRIINHPALRHLPFYLETPNDLEGYAREISMLREVYKES